MNSVKHIRVLQVEDNPSDILLVRDSFSDSLPGFEFYIEQVNCMADALRIIQEQEFDVILLDLNLPDSQGVETFVMLHQKLPDVPILVLSAMEDEQLGLTTIESGARDFISKKQIQNVLMGNSIRYAVVREQMRTEQDEIRQRESQEREMHGVERLSASSGTSVTARIYSASPLSDSTPNEFKAAVAEYTDLFDQAMDQRIFKTENQCSERLREMSNQLGFLHAGPRDIVDIHASALKAKMKDVTPQKAQAYFEEGRLMALELMGNLAGYYRSFYTAAKIKGNKP